MGNLVEWTAQGALRVLSARFAAVRTDARSRHQVFFNALAAALSGWERRHNEEELTQGRPTSGNVGETDELNAPEQAVVFGDGSPLPAHASHVLFDALRWAGLKFHWQAGDILVVDNVRTLHAREAYTPPRRILAAFMLYTSYVEHPEQLLADYHAGPVEESHGPDVPELCYAMPNATPCLYATPCLCYAMPMLCYAYAMLCLCLCYGML
eukprot:g34525.t1